MRQKHNIDTSKAILGDCDCEGVAAPCHSDPYNIPDHCRRRARVALLYNGERIGSYCEPCALVRVDMDTDYTTKPAI